MGWEVLPLMALAVLISLSLHCAYKATPSGGPEDKTPPEILYNYPPI